MTDGSGVYCHACHHQWERRRGDAEIKCPNCQNNATTEIITPEDDPRQFHNPQPQATMGSPDAAPTEAPSMEARPTPPGTHEDQGTRDAPANHEQSTSNSPHGNNTPSNSERGPQPQYFFFFPPVTFISATIVTPNHPPAPNPAPPAADPTNNSIPAPAPGPTPAPADRRSTESRPYSFNFFPFNLFAPQRTTPQESPSAPPPTGTNSPPSGTETPVASPPAAAPETPHPDHAHHNVNSNGAPNHMPVPPLASMGGPFAPFIQVTFPQGAPQQSGEQPQVFTPHVLSLLRFLSAMPAMGGDASYSEQDFERILGRLWEQSQPQGAPPASQAAIDALEVKEVDDKMLGDDGEARCVVCVDDLTRGEKVTSLPCGHFFHGECVVPWLKVHNTCPTCRGPVESSQAKAGKAAQFDVPQRAATDEQHLQEGMA